MIFNGIWGGESVRAEARRWAYESVHRGPGYLRGHRITERTWKITLTEWKWNYCIRRSQQVFCTPTITKEKKMRWIKTKFLVLQLELEFFSCGLKPEKLKKVRKREKSLYRSDPVRVSVALQITTDDSNSTLCLSLCRQRLLQSWHWGSYWLKIRSDTGCSA